MSQIRQNEPYKFHYRGLFIDYKQCLGTGLYGEVYKANCDQLPCAAKILHNHPERDTIVTKIEQARLLLSNIRHPYIAQFLDITVAPETKLPMLLMELLDENMTMMIERSQQPLAYYIQVDICHDVALAVAYLHSENIIHRDLSSNNVLIIAGKRAKVTDFCMFGIDVTDAANASPIMTSISKQSNSLDYMPPEALREPPKYTKKLDCYSEGVIMMQICTLQSPKKADRLRHIEQISSTHPFLPIINKCLNTEENDRPSAADICDSLSKLKIETKYSVSMNPAMVDTKEIVVLSDNQQSSMIQKNGVLAADVQYPNNSLSVKKESNDALKPHSDFQSKVAEPVVQSWHTGMPISPREMIRGAVALNGDEAYFMNKSGEIWLYDSRDQQPWSKVNNSYRRSRLYSSLAIVNGLLTLIGGLDDQGLANCVSNTLLSLVGDDVDTKEWQEHFPPMSTARYFAVAVTTSQHLIVAGGIGEERLSRFLPKNVKKDVNLNNVEVMNTTTDTPVWSTVASLPHPYCKMSATICRDKLYLLGGVDTQTKTLSVLACSVTKLIESNKATDGVWKKLKNDVPNFYCTCANLGEDLIVVGGEAQSARKTTIKNEVYKYSPDRGTWKLISTAPTARYNCLVATFPSQNMVVVVGGCEEKKLCTATEIWQY